MNLAIVLSGGTGTRMGASTPKQYIEVNGRPIIAYCLEKFQKNQLIDSIIVVAENHWQEYVTEIIKKERITKFLCCASAGSSRQHSIANGLAMAKNYGAIDTDNVIIHDAARPNVSGETIDLCIKALPKADGVMPVVPVKDTIYLSSDGVEITSLLNRDNLFAGQAPESFVFGKYYNLHIGLTENALAEVRGSSEIAFKNGLKIRMVPGDEFNYKITTLADLEKFKGEQGSN